MGQSKEEAQREEEFFDRVTEERKKAAEGEASEPAVDEEEGRDVPAWEREFDAYVDSNEHDYQCIGRSEGQECCLDKPWIKDFIKKWLIHAYITGAREEKERTIAKQKEVKE